MGKNKINKWLIPLCCIMIISCNKKEKNFINKDIAFNELLNLNNYKYHKTKINDSITKVFGESESKNLIIIGIIKNNNKFGWWEIKEKNNLSKIRLELMNIENKDYINQYIYLDEEKDTLKNQSLFYTTKQDATSNIIIYHVNFPSSKDEVILSKFFYMINDQEPQNIEMEKKEVFDFKLVVPHTIQKKVVKGMFTITTNREKVLGVKNLYTIDTLYSN